MIVSIIYRKSTSEYKIKRRNSITGEVSATYANRLTDEEKNWARTHGSRYEDLWTIQWTVRRPNQ
jgi:hypothetical protein